MHFTMPKSKPEATPDPARVAELRAILKKRTAGRHRLWKDNTFQGELGRRRAKRSSEMVCKCGGLLVLGLQYAHCEDCDRRLFKPQDYEELRMLFPERSLYPGGVS